jgi:hypothetical protein
MLFLRATFPEAGGAVASHGLGVLSDSRLWLGLEMDRILVGGDDSEATDGRELRVSDGDSYESDDFRVLDISEYVAGGWRLY